MTAAPDCLITALADRYRIERELGQGGMATVYLAEDLKHDRKVALKVPRCSDPRAGGVRQDDGNVLRYISLRSKVEPEDIANLAVFLASDEARHITGRLIGVDGDLQWEQ